MPAHFWVAVASFWLGVFSSARAAHLWRRGEATNAGCYAWIAALSWLFVANGLYRADW